MHGSDSLERCKEREPEKQRNVSILLTNWLRLEVGWQANLTHTLAVDRRQPHRVGCFRFQASDCDHALHVCCGGNKGGKAKKGSGFKPTISATLLLYTLVAPTQEPSSGSSLA